MDIPLSVKIGGHNWAVSYPHVWRERSDALGHCHTISCSLLIGGDDGRGDSIPDSRVRTTLLHEILHAIGDVSGRGALFGLEEKDGEGIVDSISEGLNQVFADNPDLLDLWR